MDCEDGIFKSPTNRDPSEIPLISLGEYLMNKLKTNLTKIEGRTWLQDVNTGECIKFHEIENLSRRLGSALAKLGFKKGDNLLFVTYNAVYINLLVLTIWRLGGVTRGWHQNDPTEIYTSMLEEGLVKFVLIDERTAPVMIPAISQLQWKVTLLSFGTVEDATSFSKLLEDDGTGFPEHVSINPFEDLVIKVSTSGTTGKPKVIEHSHYSAVTTAVIANEFFNKNKTLLTLAANFSILSFGITTEALCKGATVYFLSKFDSETYFQEVFKYQPEMLVMYPMTAVWFARSPHLSASNVPFLRKIGMGAAVLNSSTVRLIREALPDVTIQNMYASTECMFISSTSLGENPKTPKIASFSKDGSRKLVSTGRLVPFLKAKVIDIENGNTLKPGEEGEIVLQTLWATTGNSVQKRRDGIDADGWLHTGDLGIIDEDDYIYVIERIATYFKYKTQKVAPSEIEAVLQEHEAVQAAGIVGIPNIETDNLARAFIVLRPGHQVSADELQEYVAAHIPNEYKHLHGGVRFIDALPLNRTGKIDRIALKKFALQEN